jgi:hypothetical protein
LTWRVQISYYLEDGINHIRIETEQKNGMIDKKEEKQKTEELTIEAIVDVLFLV